ncbi:unnamed protein product [Enterobius vermicularis]|uniref:HELP domain-containing protein n=1 Tax=Enterobius vermicularis TaxID=51028 RepID=A0A0N4UY92_ENTVE|nr:unnamed protein product [Enterobius vermicularis]
MVRYELYGGPKEITKCCSTPQLMDDLSEIDETGARIERGVLERLHSVVDGYGTQIALVNEMLNAENANLRDRVCELERKVQSQEDELVCLRSSVADFLRRLSCLEQAASSRTVNPPTNQPSAYEKDVFKRLSTRPHRSMFKAVSLKNQSNYALAERIRAVNSHSDPRTTFTLHGSASSVMRNGRCESSLISVPNHSDIATESSSFQNRNGPGTSRRFVRNSDDTRGFVNVPVGRSLRGSPMRKWMSSADMKMGSTNKAHLSHNGDSDSITAPTWNLKSARSVKRLGSLTSLAASHRSLNHLGPHHRDPIYLQEQRMLQVIIRGKTTLLPVPASIERIVPTSEIDPPLSTCPRLEWVHGYRGKDSRNNLHVLPTGEIVYFIGAVVVLFDPDEMSQRHYTQHTSEIKCIAVHPNKLHIATGQTSRHSPEKKILNEHRSPICSPAALDSVLESEQTQAHVRIWDSVTLQTIRVVGVSEACFERGVSCVAFSRHDGGALLAVTDDSYDHTLSVWEWQKKKKLAEIKSANDQVFACEFHPFLKNSLVLFGKGHFNFWTFENGVLNKKPVVFEGRDKPRLVLSICFAPSEYVFSGDSDGTITAWDFRSVKIVRRAVRVHNGGVWSLCSLGGGRIVSAGKDRCLIEWSENLVKLRGPVLISEEAGIIRSVVPTRGSGLVIGTTKNEILKGDLAQGFKFVMQGHADELWALSTRPTLPHYLTGSIDGTLRLWDAFSKTMIWSMLIQEGITCLDFHCSGQVFAVGTVLGPWMVFNADTREQVHLCTDASEPVSSVRFSPDGKLIAVASKDARAYIYNISENLKSYSKAAQLVGLLSFISTLDWSTDNSLLRSNNNDFEQQIWNATTGRLSDTGKARNAVWSSSRCIVSFENGCIAQSIPGIMAIERSLDSKFVAVAIDNGAIRFYQYPTTSIMAMYREIFGHSAFIGNIGFLQTHLISIGAKDSAIFQWKI